MTRLQHVRPRRGGVWEKCVGRQHFYGNVSLGNHTQFRVAAFLYGPGIFIAVEGEGAYLFNGYTHFAYVMEKLRMDNAADARNLADFINAQLGLNLSPEVAPQGQYDESMCDR